MKLIFLFALLTSCSSFLYQPLEKMSVDPRSLGYRYEDLHFETIDQDATIQAWYFYTKQKDKRGLVLKFNETNFNMSYHLKEIIWLLEDGYDVLTFDYRGFGKSSGSPDQSLNYLDSQIIFEEGVKRASEMKNSSLIVWGKGVGGYISFRSLMGFDKRHEINLMVMDNSFCSAEDLVYERSWQHWYTVPLSPLALVFISDKMECMSYLDKWDVPTLFIHGDENTNVPIVLSQKIKDKIPADRPTWYWVSNGKGHYDSVIDQRANFNKLIDGLNFTKQAEEKKL